MKVEPHTKRESRSPRKSAYKMKKENNYSVFSELNTISHDENSFLKTKFEQEEKNAKPVFKRRNNYMYNPRRKGDLDLLLNHSKYL